MNARSQVFEFAVEGRQVEELVSSIFHTIFFHRTLGKFHYKQEGSYSVGTVGYQDVDCDFIDLTYVQTSSEQLDAHVRKEAAAFCELLRNQTGVQTGQISLEFYQKKRNRWLFTGESLPWEVWTIKTEIITLNNEQERQVSHEKLGEMISEKILYIGDVMNRHEYVPKMPNQSDLDLIFDTSFKDVQPYLFKISYNTSGPSQASVSTTMLKLIKDTLAM